MRMLRSVELDGKESSWWPANILWADSATATQDTKRPVGSLAKSSKSSKTHRSIYTTSTDPRLLGPRSSTCSQTQVPASEDMD